VVGVVVGGLGWGFSHATTTPIPSAPSPHSDMKVPIRVGSQPVMRVIRSTRSRAAFVGHVRSPGKSSSSDGVAGAKSRIAISRSLSAPSNTSLAL